MTTNDNVFAIPSKRCALRVLSYRLEPVKPKFLPKKRSRNLHLLHLPNNDAGIRRSFSPDTPILGPQNQEGSKREKAEDRKSLNNHPSFYISDSIGDKDVRGCLTIFGETW